MTSDTPDPLADLVSLRATSQAHHAQLMPHVDRLLTLAEMVGRVECKALHRLYNEEYAFVAGTLIPHMAAVEAALYDRLEAIMGPRHTMAPMREEHETVRSLIEELGRFQVHEDRCTWDELEGLALRRALYRLHALLKVHLAEEEQYLAVLDRSLTDADKDVLARALDHPTRG
ncbi:MAG TPA: hemerythrin domain-containing protein [Candidatus Limnocylindrales bacterium]|nr:hemerythrin domain-containing protein [Candidatus Limnocylindrales bacterium]